MQLTQSRKLRQNTELKIPKILAQRDKAAKYKEEEEEDLKMETFYNSKLFCTCWYPKMITVPTKCFILFTLDIFWVLFLVQFPKFKTMVWLIKNQTFYLSKSKASSYFHHLVILTFGI